MPTPKETSPRDPEEAENREANQTRDGDYPTNEPIDDPQESQENKKGGGGGGVMALGIVCFILEFICFLFIVVATPLDIYKARVKPAIGSRYCYAMWGRKVCGNHKIARKGIANHGFPCSKVNKIMTCAAAFAIISIFFTLVTMIFCLLIACRCMSPVIAAIFGLLSTIFLCITFACQCGARNKNCGPFIALIRTNYKYAAGFGLTVTAFALQCVVTILLFVCMCFGGSSNDGADKKDKENKEDKEERKKDVDAVDKK